MKIRDLLVKWCIWCSFFVCILGINGIAAAARHPIGEFGEIALFAILAPVYVMAIRKVGR